MVTKQQLVKITESAIDNLITSFKQNPYLLYTESDFHCHLFHEIFIRLPLKEWQCRTQCEKQSILLHKEYPTKVRYSAKALKEVASAGARGHFDLSIWNPGETRKRLFRVIGSTDFEREQHTFVAIEFDLIEGNDSLESAVHHFKWDLLKLRSENNEVEHGYSLVFVRDWARRDNFLEEIEKEVAKEQRITVLYAEKKGNDRIIGRLSKKQFLNYELLFK